MNEKLIRMRTYEETVKRLENKILEHELFKLEGLTILHVEEVSEVMILSGVNSEGMHGWVALYPASDGVCIGLYKTGTSLLYTIDTFKNLGYLTTSEVKEYKAVVGRYRHLSKELREEMTYQELHKKYGKGS